MWQYAPFPDASVNPPKKLAETWCYCVLVRRLTWEKMYGHIQALQHVSRRALSNSSRRQLENKVIQKQNHFQEDNEIPIHLKGGVSDAILIQNHNGTHYSGICACHI
ncbi:cytochrome c oxidase subunit 7A2, mitochondrial-like [Oncorhynchus keta]|uniref:cytochrome c oxidase subunit 7A2, mitochondrial-like n=1 Tax=Oncorhynchus keta TaxID=8018 RepID=UPI0015FE74AF|nr:cytochrome c oxidase subunit 7A2, mitochondrial-like [Oncorhynchus keta]